MVGVLWSPPFAHKKSPLPVFSKEPGDGSVYVHHRSYKRQAGACTPKNSDFPTGRDLHENNYPADRLEDKHMGWSVGMFHPESWTHISQNFVKEPQVGAMVPPSLTQPCNLILGFLSRKFFRKFFGPARETLFSRRGGGSLFRKKRDQEIRWQE